MSEQCASAPAASDALSVRREIVAAGTRWVIREIEAHGWQPGHGERSLLFGSGEVIRRVRDYPAEWWSLPAEELYAVSWHR